MAHGDEPLIKPGSLWAKKSNRAHVAKVLWVEGPYVRFEARWSTTGVLGKATDSFVAHYDPVFKEPTK